jgi:hypothetical protein
MTKFEKGEKGIFKKTPVHSGNSLVLLKGQILQTSAAA